MSYNNIEISKMTISDFEEISSTLLNDFDDFWQPSTLEKELQNENSYYIVARYLSEIVGFAGIKAVLDEADIMNIVTKKSKRNLGIGSCLLKNLIDISKENDIKKLTPEELELLKDEIRQFLIESISVTGGHLASNLGVVELKIARHLCVNLPKDKIVWDVGHK